MKLSLAGHRALLLPVTFCLAYGLFAAEQTTTPLSKSKEPAEGASGSAAPKLPDIPPSRFRPIDMFDLETISDPQISPDGSKVVFVRNFADIMKDRKRSNLWIVDFDGSDLRPVTTGNENDNSPRWSPDGKRLLYTSTSDGATQVYVRWMDSGQTAEVTRCPKSPSGMEWSPDGQWIAFSMAVPDETKPFVEMPPKPEGAEWAKPPKTIRRMVYRTDESGYLEEAHQQLFIVPSTGGAPHQLTRGPFDHEGPFVWAPDSKAILFSANRHDDWEYQPLNSEIYEISVRDGSLKALTERNGPDSHPALSPDGRQIAYLGFDDHYKGYQVSRLYIMNRDGSSSRLVTQSLDRDVEAPVWSSDGSGVYFMYDDKGNTKLAFAGIDGKLEVLAGDVGGVSPSRPYSGGSFTVSANGRFAYTHTSPDHPAEVATGRKGDAQIHRVTPLNQALFAFKELGQVEEILCESSYDKRKIQGWIVKPPGFDPHGKYPLILEIHGGPFANYGDRFSSEDQVYAAAGYVVLYTNPRGSTSYGEEFGNLIDRNYPSQDYDDLMSAVDSVIARGYVDEDNMYVTGGSGGGVLTAWIVGRTDRFRAAVSVKPVINWYSHVLTADGPGFFYRYWFPGPPWENPDNYLKRSPLSLVGNVKTPTMLLTGEADYRTPISESEQFYEALKIRKVDTALVRIPDASHMMEGRPSYLVGKLVHILKWFDLHRSGAGKTNKAEQ
jgi:dipeptidyl aminopeptidase/acylaminoacyl peptidase